MVAKEHFLVFPQSILVFSVFNSSFTAINSHFPFTKFHFEIVFCRNSVFAKIQSSGFRCELKSIFKVFGSIVTAGTRFVFHLVCIGH